MFTTWLVWQHPWAGVSAWEETCLIVTAHVPIILCLKCIYNSPIGFMTNMYKGGGENDKTLFHDMVEVNRRKKIIKCIDANGELLKNWRNIYTYYQKFKSWLKRWLLTIVMYSWILQAQIALDCMFEIEGRMYVK